MHKQLTIFIISFVLFAFNQSIFAETCPSVAQIKKHSLASGWKMYDSDDGKLIPKHRVSQLSKYIDQFALAEWTDIGHNGGVIHCYYRDKHGSDLEAYLSNDHYKPDNSKNVWYPVTGYMHCAAGNDKCIFSSNLTKDNKHFAKNDAFQAG